MGFQWCGICCSCLYHTGDRWELSCIKVCLQHSRSRWRPTPTDCEILMTASIARKRTTVHRPGKKLWAHPSTTSVCTTHWILTQEDSKVQSTVCCSVCSLDYKSKHRIQLFVDIVLFLVAESLLLVLSYFFPSISLAICASCGEGTDHCAL